MLWGEILLSKWLQFCGLGSGESGRNKSIGQTHVCGRALLSTVWEQVCDFLECTIGLWVAQARAALDFQGNTSCCSEEHCPSLFFTGPQWRWLPIAMVLCCNGHLHLFVMESEWSLSQGYMSPGTTLLRAVLVSGFHLVSVSVFFSVINS